MATATLVIATNMYGSGRVTWRTCGLTKYTHHGDKAGMQPGRGGSRTQRWMCATLRTPIMGSWRDGAEVPNFILKVC